MQCSRVAAWLLLLSLAMPMNSGARLASFVALVVSVSAAACSAETADETSGSSAAAQTAKSESTCGSYPKNPGCNAPFFLKKAWELGREDVVANVAAPIGEAGACLAGLVAAGVIIAGTAEVPPVAITAAGVAESLGVLAACVAVSKYLDRIGLAANLSCWLEPVVYDEGVFLCECKEACKAGRHNSGKFGDYSAQRKFTYGYMDRAGTSNCFCTNDAKEARCQWSCDKGWASTSPTDCTCR